VRHDYLVIGGGTAGAVVAARLSEDPGVTVGLLEWGPDDRGEPRALQIRRWFEMLEGEYDLDYRSVEQPNGNSHIRQSRARILGGCSTHNTMIAFRPPPEDFADWTARGAAGWDAETVFPYYERPTSSPWRPSTATRTSRTSSRPPLARWASPRTNAGRRRRSRTAPGSWTSATTR
jgi:choline dehydrogenase-like flavoprotein